MIVINTVLGMDDTLTLEHGDGPGEWKLRRHDTKSWLPGQPWIRLVQDEVLGYLRGEHLTKDLDKLTIYIRRLGLATPSWKHISPSHHQAARKRSIILTESPKLHLVWYNELMFIKPIPEYMLSGSFWSFLANTDQDLHKACVGFVRTYICLIRYETDFKQASDLGLIPLEKDGTALCDFDNFVKFLEPFGLFGNHEVNARFSYGELRLSRLNWLARIFLRKATYHHIDAHWRTILGHLFAPFIVLFAILSTLLSAMQVALAASGVVVWASFFKVSRWFAVVVIVMVLMLLAAYTAAIVILAITDFVFAKRMEYQAGRQSVQQKSVTLRSGVV